MWVDENMKDQTDGPTKVITPWIIWGILKGYDSFNSLKFGWTVQH